MKKSIRFIGAIIVVGVLAACGVAFGPDRPIGGEPRLVISVGKGARSAVYDDVINALYYKFILTGPSGETVERKISPGVGQLAEPVTLGLWQIRAKAYTNEDVLAGSSSKKAIEIKVIEGSNRVTIPITVHGGYFFVDIGDTPDGKVEINSGAVYHNDGTKRRPGAFPNAKIVLKVTPDIGYILKEGTLTATAIPDETSPQGPSEAADTDDDEEDEGPHITEGPLKISGLDQPNVEKGGIFSFKMPYAKVAVTAEFEILPSKITIEGPPDETINVTISNSKAPGSTSTEISFINNETLTFTVNNSAYTVGAGTLLWFIDGAEITSRNDPTKVDGSSLVISARSYNPRIYNATVMIKASYGQWYSTEFSFTVTE